MSEEKILQKIEKLLLIHDSIPPEVVKAKNIKLGLRNIDGTGVNVGITTKGYVVGYEMIADKKDAGKSVKKPMEGKLYYCGYDVEKIIRELEIEKRFGFEEVIFLLLTGLLPSEEYLNLFSQELGKRRRLTKAERSIIMQEVEDHNHMSVLHSAISHLSRCDPNPDSTEFGDVTNQCINLIAKFPTIIANSYNVVKFRDGGDLHIVRPREDLTTAENILYMIHGDLPDIFDALMLDKILILHAEHGGGNNSTFTVRTVSSSGANTYMALATGIASLSGYFHTGSDESVIDMMKDLKKNVKNKDSEKQLSTYINALVREHVVNGAGKIPGFDHAVYTLSDPRSVILRQLAGEYAQQKEMTGEYQLFSIVEKILSKVLSEELGRPVCSNIDFYSSLLYQMMGIPRELYTPLFAMARLAGWSAHRLEQLREGKIIRPAYMPPKEGDKSYIPLDKRV